MKKIVDFTYREGTDFRKIQFINYQGYFSSKFYLHIVKQLKLKLTTNIC